jgi:hypothetical protein
MKFKDFIIIIFLIFSVQNISKADDIKDFEISGFSVGDSLLNFVSKNLIINKTKSFYPNSDKYYLIEFDTNELNFSDEYAYISFHLKKDDKNFKIHSIKGMNIYDNNLEECLKKKKTIVESIQNSLTNTKEILYENSYENAYGNSKAYISDFKTINGYVRVWCANWDKNIEDEKGWKDTINVDLSSSVFLDWLNNRAYK